MNDDNGVKQNTDRRRLPVCFKLLGVLLCFASASVNSERSFWRPADESHVEINKNKQPSALKAQRRSDKSRNRGQFGSLPNLK